MQLKSFKTFIKETVREGNRLQKHDINGQQLTKRRFTTIQALAILVAIGCVFLLPKGFSDNFAGYIISFLGIFIGLFASVVISLFDKSKPKFDEQKQKEERSDYVENGIDKAKIIQLKNYVVQFTGLTSYSMLIAMWVIILLSVSLLDERFKKNPWDYPLIKSTSELTVCAVVRSIKIIGVISHRMLAIYFLINFFSISIYAITSYFSYLSSAYKEIKFK